MIILAVIIVPLVFNKYNAEEQVVIPNDAIRIRVIANSNSLEDQYEKQVVRSNIQLYLQDLLKDVQTKEETANIINANMINIDKNVGTSLKEIESNMKYRVNYGQNYFPEKEFKGITYPAGNYEALVITLGKGQGNNWWCVLFPPLCLMPTQEDAMDNVEYQLFVNEIISNYK